MFLSGLMAGMVYTRKLRAGGPGGLWTAVLGRTKTIYAWHIASFVGAFVVRAVLTEYACGYCSPAAPRLFFEHPLAALGLGASLLYQPGLLDLLPMYCVFVLLLPAVIRGLESGRRWLVLSASAAALARRAVGARRRGSLRSTRSTPGSFNLLAWQFIFVAGVAIGHARRQRPPAGRPAEPPGRSSAPPRSPSTGSASATGALAAPCGPTPCSACS